MAETPLTPRESSRRTVRRVTKGLAALAVAATAAFAAAAASATKHDATTVDDSSSSVVIEDDSWDGNDYGASYGISPPSSTPSVSSQAPAATSGGS